jgi:hypothetical protein
MGSCQSDNAVLVGDIEYLRQKTFLSEENRHRMGVARVRYADDTGHSGYSRGTDLLALVPRALVNKVSRPAIVIPKNLHEIEFLGLNLRAWIDRHHVGAIGPLF